MRLAHTVNQEFEFIMQSNLEKAKHQRLKIVQYYSTTAQFIIRLLIGMGIYIVIRIGMMAYFTQKIGLSFTLCDSLAELIILMLTSLLMILFIWLKGTRFHLAASVWMPAIACLAFADWVRFFMTLSHIHWMDAVYGTLPFVLPLTLMVIFWIFDPDKRFIRILETIILTGLCVFWAIDLPRSIQEAKDLQVITSSYQEFYQEIQDTHHISWYEAPESLRSGKIYSEWGYKPLKIDDYRVDKDIKDIHALLYVIHVDIVMPGMKELLPISTQELKFPTLEHISLHYFYKYSTERRIVIRNFQYSGDAFFLVKHENGEQTFVDNVLIRKINKESE